MAPCVFCFSCSQAPLAARTGAAEFRCPAENIGVDELEDDRYRVRGCGRTQIYQCASTCWREGWLARFARERASREFACNPEAISVRWIQEETYRVKGCAHEATYECADERCWPEGTRRVPAAQINGGSSPIGIGSPIGRHSR